MSTTSRWSMQIHHKAEDDDSVFERKFLASLPPSPHLLHSGFSYLDINIVSLHISSEKCATPRSDSWRYELDHIVCS